MHDTYVVRREVGHDRVGGVLVVGILVKYVSTVEADCGPSRFDWKRILISY